MKTLFSLVESSFSPHFPDLYQALDIVAERFDSARNLHRALQKQAPDFKVIVVMQPSEAPHIGKLLELFPIHAVLKYSVAEEEMRAVLQPDGE